MEHRRPRNPPMRPLVLIVDGHEESLALYAIGLSAMGFDVLAAKDGAQAFTKAWEIHPDIIVTELPMPDCDGWEFLQRLKGNPRTRDVPVVAVSGHVQQSVRERAQHDGFAALFWKPCMPDQLAEGLRQVLGGNAYAQAQVGDR